MSEKTGFAKQTLNKIAEVALSTQIKAQKLEVDIETNLQKITHGDIDHIAIKINHLTMQNPLQIEMFKLDIGQVTVQPMSAIRGKIKLVHPSEGKLELEVNEGNLHEALHRKLQQTVQLKLLENGRIAFKINPIDGMGDSPELTVMAVAKINSDRKTLLLELFPLATPSSLPPEQITHLFTTFSEILDLKNLEKAGTTLTLDQFEITSGWLHLKANAHIDKFPSS
ncbi:DUF2993 domain-containing protein [Planktothrix sp. FACHB-1365]|uniref:LmeA family phospholipid-binding protein n=1 Tax=Planktothrix sp. FACHB-1365 TaxID=2692855 RepID=UPI0016855F84|nr:DUF2993 domain-containing protein [Planktothrix sp. FACHB-1365]MBD2484770.1 LmeA family phospholipid-binding protein [Planktothrix sp. FACHB-1365]